jgi:hypothetical protein
MELPPMFASTSVHVPEAPAGTPTFLTSPPPSQPGGNGAAPPARTVSGMARSMIERVWS